MHERHLRGRRSIEVGARLVTALLLSGPGTAFAQPQQNQQQVSGYAAEIATIDLAERRLTLKASMGETTVRVAKSVALEALKPGDKVRVTFGQVRSEPVITRVVVNR
jgi:Cu/Ag efflux protein CusF